MWRFLFNLFLKGSRFSRTTTRTTSSTTSKSRFRLFSNLNHFQFKSKAPKILSILTASSGISTFLSVDEQNFLSKIVNSESEIQIISRLDEMYDLGPATLKHSYVLLREALRKEPNNVEFLWRFCRVCVGLASDPRLNESSRDSYWKRARKCIEQALSIPKGNKSADCHKWLAITLSYDAFSKPHDIQMEAAIEIRNHLEIALKISPKDNSCMHLLGLWYFDFAERTNWQKIFVKITRKKPFPETSYQDALKWFLEADSLKENFMKRNTIMIGKTYFRIGDKEKAKEYLQKAVLLPNKNIEDERAHEDAATIFKKLQ